MERSLGLGFRCVVLAYPMEHVREPELVDGGALKTRPASLRPSCVRRRNSSLSSSHHLLPLSLFFLRFNMVQGSTKGMTNKASSSRHAVKAAKNMPKGRRAIAPKKPILVKQASMHQVCVFVFNLCG